MRVNELICKVWLNLSAEDNIYADQWISDKTWLRVICKCCARHGPRRGTHHRNPYPLPSSYAIIVVGTAVLRMF